MRVTVDVNVITDAGRWDDGKEAWNVCNSLA